MDIQKELERELQRLQADYGRGKELHIEWAPRKKAVHIQGKIKELAGEVDRDARLIYVYETEVNKALHTTRHEFFEYILDLHLIGPYVCLYNQMQKAYEAAFMENQYANKEALIEILVENEEKRIGQKK